MPTEIHPKDQLLDFAYDELPQGEVATLQAHLRGCPECARELEGIRGVRRIASQLPAASPPDSGLDSLLAYAERAARISAAPPVRRPWGRWLSAAVSVVAVAVIAVTVFGDPARRLFGSSADALGGNSPVAMRAPIGERRQVLLEKKSLKSFGGGSAEYDMAPPPSPPAASKEAFAAAPRKADAMRKGAAVGFLGNSRPGGRVASRARHHRVAHHPPARAAMPKPVLVPASAPAVSAGAQPAADRVAAAKPSLALARSSGAGRAISSTETLTREARAVRARIPGAKGATLAMLLDRLCGLEMDLGHREEARKACARLARDFPNSVFAKRARARLSRLERP